MPRFQGIVNEFETLLCRWQRHFFCHFFLPRGTQVLHLDYIYVAVTDRRRA